MSQFELNRREFIALSAIGSAMLLLHDTSLAGVLPARVKRFGKFEELPPGAVRPEGWLRLYLEKQAEGLGSNLPKVSWPFTEPYWKGETQGESWWPWEQTAYWVDGAVRLALVLDDKSLMRQVGETIDYTLGHIDPDGYIGPAFFKDPKENFHRWPHTLFFRGLEATAEANGRRANSIAEAMRKHYVSDPAEYGKPTRNVTNIEPMLWCYEQTADSRLLERAEKAWADYETIAADPEHGDLSKERVEANTPINAHGVTYQETAKQPAILYYYTGKQEYLDFAIGAQRRAIEHHMLVDGIPSTSEWYRTTTSLDSHETCCISDHTWSWGHLLLATGDGAWGDRIERAVFNAGMGAVKKDWKAVQYFSCPNQVIATLNSDHNVMAFGGRMMAYQPNPGQHTACCGGNVHRFLPNYACRMWMRTRDGGLAATLYGPSTLRTTVQGRPITIEQATDYPFDERIVLKIGLQSAVSFPLMLRVPAWCAAAEAEVNGEHIPLDLRDGFATIRREFQPNDVVTLTLPMSVRSSRSADGGIAFEHGPLVYSLPVREEWKAVVEPRYTTAEYPSWNATAASAWNYGAPGQAAKFSREAMPRDPWVDPPTKLAISARKIAWELRTNPKDPNQKFTPRLPETMEPQRDAETLSLVPYGATHLRLTFFPKLPD
ncbi:MAG TPA: beta-L-arabinofuranosidase domain-containing protein [Fimbriimonadaceae bacterium]|nr:beta-L-arabinofuranosidase domain-containing protein [Fimbriimonadaceae bacterium]